MDSIEVYFSQSDDLKGDLSGLFEICEKVVIAADLDSGVRILNIRLCGAQEMIELNKKWRGKDKITDVLSFENTENAEIKSPVRILGDLVICLEQAQAQSSEFGHSVEEEVAALTAHGYCHLIGLDHELGEPEAKKQLEREMAILGKAGFNKELSLLSRKF